ncbi:MAG: zinc dependent phospholipase C family protein [Chitinophagales bacterium]
MKKLFLIFVGILLSEKLLCWGFFAHQKINYYAVFLLPPEMMVLYKSHISFLSDHAVDPDKRRYILAAEAPRHFIDIDHYGAYPFTGLPRNWDAAVLKFTEDSLRRYGVVPWWILVMKQRLTQAFREKNQIKILRLSAEIGHYIADAHVPLHVSSNHNGQLTNQEGIHAFWESRIPELLADKEWDFFIGHADYLSDPSKFIWKRVLESAASADTVLRYEKILGGSFREDLKYAFEERNGKLTRQYSSAYSISYDRKLNHMIERRMRESIAAVASFWYTAWVDAGQPDLKTLVNQNFSQEELKEFEKLDEEWKKGKLQGDLREE